MVEQLWEMLDISKITLAYSNRVNFSILIEQSLRDVMERKRGVVE